MCIEMGCGLRKLRNIVITSAILWPLAQSNLTFAVCGLMDYGWAPGCEDPRLRVSLTAFDQHASFLPVALGLSCGQQLLSLGPITLLKVMLLAQSPPLGVRGLRIEGERGRSRNSCFSFLRP